MERRIHTRVITNGPPIGEITFDDKTAEERQQLIAHYQGIVAIIGSTGSSQAKDQLEKLLALEPEGEAEQTRPMAYYDGSAPQLYIDQIRDEQDALDKTERPIKETQAITPSSNFL